MNIFNFFHIGHHDVSPSPESKPKDGDQKHMDERERNHTSSHPPTPKQKFDRSKYLKDYGYFNKKTEIAPDKAYQPAWV
jgi:hypothetical protein